MVQTWPSPGRGGIWCGLCNLIGLCLTHFQLGQVFQATDIFSGKSVAIKMEDSGADLSQVEHEDVVYKLLGSRRGIPRVLWFGKEGYNNILILELLGPSFFDEVSQNRPYPLVTVLPIAIEIVCEPIIITPQKAECLIAFTP